MLVKFNEKNCQLNLRAEQILMEFAKEQNEFTWHPEYGKYMMESTPGSPYGHEIDDVLQVEKNMIAR